MPIDLVERVELLERQNRMLKLWSAIGIPAMGCLFLLASCNQASTQEEHPLPGTVEAKKFVLRDNNGVMRAALLMTGEGAGLQIYDPEGKTVRARLGGSDGTGGQLWLWDQNDQSRIVLKANHSGESLLTLRDTKGNEQIMLRAGNVPIPGLHLYETGIYLFERVDNLYVIRGLMNLTKDERAPLIEFRDRDEKTIWKAPPK